jgi:putative tryptophan/tyrosine transport system substrate-binding protein
LQRAVRNGRLLNLLLAALFARLRQLGYTEGKNLIVDRYAAEGRAERFAEIARNMVQAKPDVIVLGLNHELASQVAKATSTIPTVALIGSVDAGLVHNISRPEGNVTGIIFDAGIEMQGKHLDLLRQAVPSASRVAYLFNRYDWEGAWGHAVLEAGRRSGISIIGIPVEYTAGEPEYRRAFETMAQQSADALEFNGLAPNFVYGQLITQLALKYRLPSICWDLTVVEKGQGLLAYGADFPDFPERLGDLVDQLFRGVKVADIPITQPTKFILAINLKTAKALRLEIPPALVAQADEVIE